MGASICPDCKNVYTDEDIELGIVLPCSVCYKCYLGDCETYSCNCNENDIRENK